MGAHEAGPRFRMLGTLSVTDAEGAPVPLGGRRPRELLAVLLLHPNRSMGADRLVTALWGEDAGDGAATTLRTHVATVRRVLTDAGAPDALTTAAGGYSLGLDPDDLDAEVFERLVHQGEEALALGDPERAATLLDRALRLWRGEPLSDLGPPDFATARVARLDELRLVAEENAATAALALGRHRELVGPLQALVAAHPFRERFCGQLMLALYRSGRQADALAAYAETKQQLADELGLDPGPELRELETAMLRQDPTLLAPRDDASGGGPAHPPGKASRTVARQPADAVFSALRRSFLVGRGDEREVVVEAWRACCDGDRGLLLLSGQAGAGKSRLAAELAHTAAEDGGTVLVGRCEEGVPHSAFTSALADSRRAQELATDAPEGVRLGLRPLLPALGLGAVAAGEPAAPAGREGLYGAAHWLVGALAAEGPLLLVVEDAERLDDAGSALLRSLVTRLPARTLLAVCFRDPPGSRHAPLGELLAHPGVPETARRVELGPLSIDDLGALVASVHPAAGPYPEPFVTALWEQTGGNPFFAQEVLRDLEPAAVRAGRLDLRLPAGVRDVLRHRLQRLPTETRDALSAAAVLGRQVELARLGELLDSSEDRIVDALEGALAAGLLVESGSSWAGGYAFPHELMREAVYADIPVPRRQRLHLRALAALTERPTPDADVLAAAGHACAAGPAADPVEAHRLVARASRLAAARFGYEEAVRLAESRLPLVARYGSPAEQADAAVDVARLRMRSGRGYARAVALLDDALATYLDVGDTEAAGRVHSWLGGLLSVPYGEMDVVRSLEHFEAAERLLSRPEDAFHLHRGRMGAAMIALDTRTLRAAAERCAGLAASLGRRDLAAAAGWGQGWLALDLGSPDEALECLTDAWGAVQDLGDPAQGWPVANAAALIGTVFLQDPSEGRAWCRRAMGHPRFQALQHPHAALADQLVLALVETGELEPARRAAAALPADAVGRRLVRFRLGEWEEAAEEWQRALARDLAVGDRHDAVLNSRWLGEALLVLGDVPRAVEVLSSALEIAAAAPQVPSELWLRARLATVTGQGEAAVHLARCEELLGDGGWRGLVGEVLLARAAVANDSGAHAAAEQALAEAEATFAAYRLPWRRAAALHASAQLLRGAGRPVEAAQRSREADAVLVAIGAPSRWLELGARLNGISTRPHES